MLIVTLGGCGGGGNGGEDDAGDGENCGNGVLDLAEECDGTNYGGALCQDFGFYSGNLTCLADCTIGLDDCAESCGDGQINGDEECDGSEFGDASCSDYSYYGGSLTCSDDCQIDETTCTGICGDAEINGTEECDTADFGAADCTDYGFHSGSLTCDEDCTIVSDGCTEYCGDSVLNGPEECDNADFGTASCADFAFYSGGLSCDSDCEIVTTGCSQFCGDSVLNGPEECDNTDLGTASCADFSFYSGSLSCDVNCNILTGGCSQFCGDTVKNGPEECDDTDFGTLSCSEYGFGGGTLLCDTTCGVDTSNCEICLPGQFHCEGNEVMECDAGPPSQWVSMSTPLICDAAAGYTCDETSGTCVDLTPIGDATPTGTFYRYATFTESNSQFLRGSDVGSYGDLIYVNRGPWYQDGQYLDVYQVTLLDSDGDGLLEPHQHPDNPSNTGPIEQRSLTYVWTYHIPALGMVHRSEVYPLSDRVYFVAGIYGAPGVIYEYIFATGVTNTYVTGSPAIDFSFIGYGDVDGRYYAGWELERRVYSIDPAIGDWVAEFEYPALGGSHFDGLEVVEDPGTGTQYVYVSDTFLNLLGQYRRDPALGWVKENVFAHGGSGNYVQGMTFGAHNHFWVTGYGSSGSTELYEIGGGDLTPYVE